MKKLKVAISGLIYPVTMMRFFWEALERREDVELYSLGPYYGQYIPWNGGIQLNSKYVKQPTLPLPTVLAQNKPPYRMIENQLPSDIDIFIQVDAGWHFSTRPNARKVVLVETDPHVLNYSLPRSYSDVVFCMQTPYMKSGENWLPYACDTVHFYPEDGVLIKHDACLVGLQYEQRTKLVGGLRRKNYGVYYDIGKVYDEYRKIYNSSRVALCWSSLLDLPVRVFEAMGMARPLVVNRNIPDLHKLFKENEHFMAFDTVEEGIEKVEYLLSHREYAEEMRFEAYREVMKNHTWDIRVQQMLDFIGA